MELNWILTCITAKGLMNRAHASTAAVQANAENNQEDPDHGVELGLYEAIPILMTADILMFTRHEVPVGPRPNPTRRNSADIAGRFNHRFKEVFTLPEVKIDENVELFGRLGRTKMSKPTVTPFRFGKTTRKPKNRSTKSITKYERAGRAKQPDESPLFEIYKASPRRLKPQRSHKCLPKGLAWGEAKTLGRQNQRRAG